MTASPTASELASDYAVRLSGVLHATDWSMLSPLADALLDCWRSQRQAFWIGNGGSAGNAAHLVNDYLYPVSKRHGSGLRAHALSANGAVITCLANDEGYEEVFAKQLAVMADPGDLLIAFSGSGNSPNILRGLAEAKRIGMVSFAVLGFDGGKAREMCDHLLHFPVTDMQIAEDLQLITGHMLMQYLYGRRDG